MLGGDRLHRWEAVHNGINAQSPKQKKILGGTLSVAKHHQNPSWFGRTRSQNRQWHDPGPSSTWAMRSGCSSRHSLAVHKPKTTQDWPPYLSDLNPMYERPVVDFRGQVCAKTQKCLEWLKQSLCLEWDRMSLEECDDSVESFKTRLNPYIRAKGGHFKTDWICDYQRSILLLLIVDFPKFDVITEI